MKSLLTKSDNELINKYRDTGRIAFIYPRLKRISLNGGRQLDFTTGLKQISEFIKTLEKLKK